MGKRVLDRGLIPPTAGDDVPSARLQFDLLWAILSFHAHRFSGRPIAEMLVSWTTIMLMDRGYAPTIGDLSKATGIPRPTVSRYVNHQIEEGWAEERVNPANRRRRELFLTEAGVREMEFIVSHFHETFSGIMADAFGDSAVDDGAGLLAQMHAMSDRMLNDAD